MGGTGSRNIRTAEDNVFTRLPQSREQISSNRGAPRSHHSSIRYNYFNTRDKECRAGSKLEITTVKFRLLAAKIRTARVSLDREDDIFGQEDQKLNEEKLNLVHLFGSGVNGSIVSDKAQKITSLFT